MKVYMVHLLLQAFLTLVFLSAYDRFIIRPTRVIGIVDTSAVFRIKEAQLIKQLHGSEQEQAKASAEAKAFASAFSTALEALPDQCGCPVIDRTVVIGSTPYMVDLTPALKRRLGL
ncbi:hypothetical protein GJ700_02435 [Duganella sp. FT92W]|uniref:Uncharacterized protein n=1 Tax=Pseudoduganella rivuli TaxID=2666085 RepID=A0A7X2LQW3_9BURK|nr:hypothetical protein [Pseudoduganella rivuli]MRV70576.1 hypothetical protein [Pseudoduganella rivuli]